MLNKIICQMATSNGGLVTSHEMKYFPHDAKVFCKFKTNAKI